MDKELMFNISEHPEVQSVIHAALLEDGAATITAHILARHDVVVAGGDVAAAVFHALDKSIVVEQHSADGKDVKAGESVVTIRGRAAPILSGERTALNFMQRMTGIATLTRSFVKAVEGTGCKILDTRKTVPGLRVIDKYSVKCGGGTNHRLGLSDMVLIKDNHRRLWKGGQPSELGKAVVAARKSHFEVPVEVEVETFDELRSALEAKPEWIMLDNMPPAQMKEAVAIIAGRCKVEASGGITMANIRAVAETGVDAISLGCLTHSVTAADLSLEIL